MMFPTSPGGIYILPSMKLTFSHLKMDGWKTILSFCGPAYFQVRTFSFKEDIHLMSQTAGFNVHLTEILSSTLVRQYDSCVIDESICTSSKYAEHWTHPSPKHSMYGVSKTCIFIYATILIYNTYIYPIN